MNVDKVYHRYSNSFVKVVGNNWDYSTVYQATLERENIDNLAKCVSFIQTIPL